MSTPSEFVRSLFTDPDEPAAVIPPEPTTTAPIIAMQGTTPPPVHNPLRGFINDLFNNN